MALIVCTECGKTFSDKAPSCPQCGCPTDMVLKDLASKKAPPSAPGSGSRASEIMLSEVKKAREEGRAADRLFDSRNRSIQMKASTNIDLFGGYATSRVVDIRADARRACDDLYATYQSLVERLDAKCRPLLSASPSGEAIQAVADAIRYFNEESEIESNFTASFNGEDLGNVANSRYVVSVSNQMIQKFWESTFAATPYAVEQEKRKRQEAQEERKRRDAERARRAEERKKEEARKAEALQKAKEHAAHMETEAKAGIAAFEAELAGEAERHVTRFRADIENQADAFRKEIAGCKRELAALVLFAPGAKRALRTRIARLERKLEKLQEPERITREATTLQRVTGEALEEYRTSVEAHMDRRFPGRNKTTGTLAQYAEAEDHAGLPLPKAPDAGSVLDRYR